MIRPFQHPIDIRLALAIGLAAASLGMPSSTRAIAQPADVTLRMRDGTERAGRLISVDQDGIKVAARIGSSLKETTFSRSEVDQITLRAIDESIRAEAAVNLLDGTRLLANELRLANREVAFQLPIGISVSVPTRLISEVVLQPTTEIRDASGLIALVAETRLDQDALIVDRDNQYRAIEGIVEQIDKDQLTVTIGEQTAQVGRDRITAIKFFHARVASASRPVARCEFASGGTLFLAQLVQTEGRIKLQSAGGLALDLPASELATITFASTSIVDLGSVPLISNDWQPLLANDSVIASLRDLNRAQVDQSFDGGPLKLETQVPSESGYGFDVDRQTYQHGLAIQGGGRVVFRLDGQYQTLVGKLGFDPTADDNGHVLVQFITDDRVAYETRLVKRTADGPVAFEIPVANCNRLEIQVDYSDGRSTGDRIHIVDPQLSK